jgi:hypothetical protein
LKRWLQMSGAQIAKLASSFSLFAVFAIAHCDSFRDFQRALASASSKAEVLRAAEEFSDLVEFDSALEEALEDLDAGTTVIEFKRLVALRAASESDIGGDAANQAKAIKSNPLYRDPGVQEESNWLYGALKRLADLIPKRGPQSNMSLPRTALPGWIVPGMWGLLAMAVLVFGYFVFRHFSWKMALTRKAKAMLEEDEPERTLDEWLEMADRLTAEGKYREAVRAMYLSCLLKFDEAGIARFVRGETNWEHLARISSSVKKPSGLDFRPPTQTFDRIWYGHHVRGREDVDQFRAWYQQIVEALRGVGK